MNSRKAGFVGRWVAPALRAVGASSRSKDVAPVHDERENSAPSLPQDDALNSEQHLKDSSQSPTGRAKTNGRITESVDAAFLAEELLQYAIIPASQEELEVLRAFAIDPVSEELFQDELQFLKLFLVDYCLGSMAANHGGLEFVRKPYYREIESYCVDEGFDYPTILERFEIYTRACNAYLDYAPEKRERLTPYWELGKAFSRFVSDGNPDARELSIFDGIFCAYDLHLATVLSQYEISIRTR